MSHRGLVYSNSLAAAVIDSLEFARHGGQLAGKVAIADLARLAELTEDDSGYLDCIVTGEQDADGNGYLVVHVSGQLHLRCQRCLRVLEWPLRTESRLMLVAPGAAWPDEDLESDQSDAIEADRAQPLLSLIEDEVMLALPISPRHEVCDLPATAKENGELSPFASLAKLNK